MERYTPSLIEPKWQAYWAEHKTFRTPEDPALPKKYILDMFPYPSGAGLHVGHPEGYTATDILCRYYRAKGHAVLHPMGWDAFGLPAEQYAIQTGTHPAITTQKNIDTFRRQIQALGLSYDWDREVDTTDPAYVKWTQWIFLQLYKRGLAYQTEIPVNWCPALGTVLANEEVIDGKSERGSHPVVRLPLRQWMLKITAYADRLLDDLDLVSWPESTKTMQAEWIGRSEGALVKFPLASGEGHLEIFTTRPDTLYGVTFMVIAPEHPLLDRLVSEGQRAEVEAYVAKARNRSDLDRKAAKEKTGVATGGFVTHPLTGQPVPVWVADYVLMGYGTGAIMAVPGHDERDFEFARTFGIPVVQVVSAEGTVLPELTEAYTEQGVAVNSGPYNGLTTEAFKAQVTADLEAAGQGARRVEYRLRDWVFSRQRYWGEPFPIYFPVTCEGDPRKGEAHTIHYDQPIAMEESELPLRLPDLEDFNPGEDPAGTLARAADWRFFQKEGRWFARETNTMPQWAGSCWYYLRYLDPKNPEEAWSKAAAERWLPVDLYVGGAEHAVLHLLYARFWHKVLQDAGHVQVPEPFGRLVHQGMILGEVEYTAYRDAQGAFLSKERVMAHPDGGFRHRDTGEEVTAERVAEEATEKKGSAVVLKADPAIQLDARAYKMSKSRGNVINPDDVIREHGADALRLYEMFLGPLEATKPWSTSGIQGVSRFLERVYALAQKPRSTAAPEGDLLRLLHKTIRKVGEDIEALRLNTGISALMILLNELSKASPLPQEAVETLVRLLHPYAPHLAEELWEQLGHAPSLQAVPWPAYDEALCVDSQLTIAVQVGGKMRGTIQLAAGASQEEAQAEGLKLESVQRQMEGKTLRKTIWVQDKLLNLIVG